MKFALGPICYNDWIDALRVSILIGRNGYIAPPIQALVSPEDLRWFEEDKKRQEPHAV